MSIKEAFKEYRDEYGVIYTLLIFLYKIVYRKRNEIYKFFLRRFAKIKDDCVVFTSTPDYSDNARALSEYMVKLGLINKYHIYWIVNDKEKCETLNPNAGVTFISRNENKYKERSLRGIRCYFESRYLLATHEFEIPKSQNIFGHEYIRLWHGCGYKDNDKPTDGTKIFDKHLVPGPIFVETKSKFWNAPKSYFIPIGLPRYDWLLNQSDTAIDCYNYIKNNYSKIIIWMPTFRNMKRGGHAERNITQFPLMASTEDWYKVDACCKVHNILLIVKLHVFQKSYGIDFSYFTNIIEYPSQLIEEKGCNLYEFLSQTDALISDYSSVAIDYLVVNKPIAFALDDFEAYRDSRGFVFTDPRDYMPGHHLYNVHDLECFIRDMSLNNDKYYEARQIMINHAINKESCYCKAVLKSLKLD